MIEVEHVCLSFGKRKILEDVNLTVYDGETMVILGASGSGKSTLLKLIIGLLKPDSGSIKVNGKEISSLTEREMNEERRRMGMVFQYSALFDSMNVKENVAFGLRQHTDLSEEEIENITEGKLHLVGLDDVGDLMPADLSGGMKKRVSLARAIALNPQIILYDEPTAGLDPMQRVQVRKILAQLSKAKIIICATHVISDVELIANEFIFLKQGKIIQRGTMNELAELFPNHVYEITCDEETCEKLKRECCVTRIQKKNEGYTVRVITKEIWKDYKSISPSLEDLYLNDFEDEQLWI